MFQSSSEMHKPMDWQLVILKFKSRQINKIRKVYLTRFSDMYQYFQKQINRYSNDNDMIVHNIVMELV
jgi:hypothetical protein